MAYASALNKLRTLVTGVLGADAKVAYRLVRGSPSSVLLAESAQADLLVLDAPRRRASLRSPILAHRLIYAAACPILIMPPVPLNSGT